MLKITKKMSGKMQNMISINTSSLDNAYCVAMAAKKASVCSNCYSNKMLKMYKSARAAFKHNGDMLNAGILTDDQLPKINAHTIRFDAFGEIDTITQLINYIKICEANPRTNFTLWTKRRDLVFKAIRDFGKPANLILVYSSKDKNTTEKLPEHFDKVFTVFTKDYVKTNNTAINCGALKCFDCMACYDPSNKTQFINELLK